MSLVPLLQTLYRPNDLKELHFAALGVEVRTDVPPEELLPDASYLPSASGWDGLTIDEAREKDPTFRRPLSNGNKSPEARVYLERRNELLVQNQAAFRTVRRLRPEPGKPPVRLGNCYEFFKQMEFMAGYWDDTSLPLPDDDAMDEGEDGAQQGETTPAVPLPPGTPSGSAGPGAVSGAPVSNARSQPAPDTTSTTATATTTNSATTSSSSVPERVTWRRQPGSEMPPEHRHNFLTAFVKLVSYDFGCNVGPARVEPRLQLIAPPGSKSRFKASKSAAPKRDPQPPPGQTTMQVSSPPTPPPPFGKASYFPAGSVFVHRIPTTREAARAGIVEGPVAAVSARGTTSFHNNTDDDGVSQESLLDLGRELLVALSTAQLRARERRPERRFGEGRWWATAKRWGGGEGGPIGREAESAAAAAAAAEDKDKGKGKDAPAPSPSSGSASSPSGGSGNTAQPPSSSSTSPAATTSSGASHPAKLMAALGPGIPGSVGAAGGARPTLPVPLPPLPIPMRGSGAGAQPPATKRRKTPSIYDHYRAVRPPASNWDRKARYEAVGRVRVNGGVGGEGGADVCDDVFLFSCLFHHFSVVRVRVPDRLIDVLDGDVDVGASAEEVGGEEEAKGRRAGRSWGRLEVSRSRWFDLFLVEDRLEAMRLLWGVMAWLMRRQEQQQQQKQKQGPGPQGQQRPGVGQQAGMKGGGGAGGEPDPDVIMKDV